MKKSILLVLAIAATQVASAANDSTEGTDTGSEVAATTNEFGLLRVDSALTDTIVAVPWLDLSGDSSPSSVKVADIVKTANLTEGDRLSAYKPDGTYDVWVLDDGEWVPSTTAVVDNNEVSEAPAATSRTLALGGAFWLYRQNPTTSGGAAVPFYVYGQVSDAAVTTAVTAGTAETPVWNLVANASDAPFALNPAVTGAGASDEIYLVSEGAPTKYTLKDGVWGSIVVQTVDGRTVRRWTAADVTISKGTGFWYVSKGGSPTFNW